MRELFAMLLAGLSLAFVANARPANPLAVATPQPDGTQVTLQLCGDEFYHFSTTTDGYTVLKNASGYWVYAQRDGEVLRATTVVAHDAGQRTAAEQALLAATPRGLTDRAAVGTSRRSRALAQAAPARVPFDYDKFRGLIILVQPSDVTFSMGDDTQHFYNTIVNQANMTQVGFGDYGDWTGSVRDYFYDNTMGVFEPQFDIVGPVKVSYKSTQIGSNYVYAFQTALRLVNSEVDYTKYDSDGDGVVDMVYFIVAGNTAAIQGNEQYGYLWPHASYGVGSGTYDGKRISRYACSTELNGPVAYSSVDGIGTICHEFTHVLGLPDLYDTDYGENGLAHQPGAWDIMAAGTDLNNGRTPPGYSAYERYSLGLTRPRLLDAAGEGTYTLNALPESNECFILRTPVDKEYFILENRQTNSKWDTHLPGHGLLVNRVDSTDLSYWSMNKVNCYPEHMCYELLRAGNTVSGDLASDPVPGQIGVPVITNATTPGLLTSTGEQNAYDITRIAENNGVITFDLVKSGVEKVLVETFTGMEDGSSPTFEAQGTIALWRLAQCTPVTDELGNTAVAMRNPSVLQMQETVCLNTAWVSVDVSNSSATPAKLTLQSSVDGGKKWVAAQSCSGGTSFTVPGSTSLTTYWVAEFDNTQPVQYRIQMTAGSKTAPCQVDNFTLHYTGEPGTGEDYPVGDVNGDGRVDIDDVNILLNIILEFDTADRYGGRATVTGGSRVSIDDVNAVINILLQ